jgi:hypothetical protein
LCKDLTCGQIFSIILPRTDDSVPAYSISPYHIAALSNDTTSLVDSGIQTVQHHHFVIVQPEVEVFFALPITTYRGHATTECGVIPSDHAILCHRSEKPHLVPHETGITMDHFSMIVLDQTDPPLPTSRINFGAYYPIQYNVKVKNLGYIPEKQLGRLVDYWRETCERISRSALNQFDIVMRTNFLTRGPVKVMVCPTGTLANFLMRLMMEWKRLIPLTSNLVSRQR